MKKRITAIIMAMMLSFSCVACSIFENGGEKPTSSNVAVWTATGMEKILMEEDYSSRYDSKTLSISAFRNEYEAGQIIISADKETKANVKAYDIELDDLVNETGDVLTKESWNVYNQKYTQVTKILNTETDLRPGWYPDALLPFETAKEYGENSIKWEEEQDNANQGIWLEVKPSKTLLGGVYTGTFDLTVDGKLYEIPVSVKVYDYTIGDYTHTKSSFALSLEGIAYAELNSTKEMMDTYYDFVLAHRINPQNLQVGDNMQCNLNDPAIMEEFLSEACEVALDPRWTSFNLPFMTATKRLYIINKNGKLNKLFTIDSENNIDFQVGKEAVTEAEKAEAIASDSYKTTTVVDYNVYKTTLLEVAKRGLSESLKNVSDEAVTEPVDIMSKAGTYFIFYDEFNDNGTEATASYCQERAWQVNQEVAAELETVLTCTEEEAAAFENKYGITFAEYKATIINSCKHLKNKVVGTYTESLLAEHGQYVTLIEYLNNETVQKNTLDYAINSYGEDDYELWLYTCCFPHAPYPTFQVDDYLLSSRIYGWLMYEYGAVGHLFWTLVLNVKRYITSAAKDDQLMDFFTDPLRYPSGNGDGFLVYAGREYGISGPIDTIRFQSLRDGIEDYDLLYELQEVYDKRGVTQEQFESVYEKLHEKLHNVMKVNHSDNLVNDFINSRETLGALLENAYSENQVLVESYEVKRGVGNVTVSANKGVNVTCNNQTAEGTEHVDIDGNEYVRYNFNIALDGTENYLTLVATGSETTEIRLNLGGKSQVIGGENLKGDIVYTSDATCNMTNDTTIEREVDEELVQEKVTMFTFSGSTQDKAQRLEWNATKYSFNSTTKKVTLSVYSDREESFALQVFVKTKSSSIIRSIAECQVKKGWNEIEIPVSILTFKGVDDVIEKIYIDVEGIEGLTFAMGSVTVEG